MPGDDFQGFVELIKMIDLGVGAKRIKGHMAITECDQNTWQASVIGGLNVDLAIVNEGGAVKAGVHDLQGVEDMAWIRLAKVKRVAVDNGGEKTLQIKGFEDRKTGSLWLVGADTKAEASA